MEQLEQQAEGLQRVLVVDDEPRNRRIILEILEESVEARGVGSGEEALQALGEFRPDLVLLDVMMHGVDGYEVCRRIRADSRQEFTKIILVSGKAALSERLLGYEAGADDYLAKPYAPEEMQAKVKVFLRLVKAEKELASLNQSLEARIRERTERIMEAEAKLRTAAKMSALGEMAGGIAHEINTPLGTIGLLADQARELLGDPDIDRTAVSEMVRSIGDTVKRIGAIIKGLRSFSRSGENDAFGSCKLSQILENTLALCGERLKHAAVELRAPPVPEDVVLFCESVQISQVLLNLIANACDAIECLPERWIRIEARSADGRVRLAVSDSGTGIPDEALRRIFEPFFTTKGVGKGTGLGLSISRKIMEAHGGSLAYELADGHTCFVLECPAG